LLPSSSFFFPSEKTQRKTEETFPPDLNEAFRVLSVVRFLCTTDQAAESIQGEGMRQFSLCSYLYIILYT